MRRHLDRRTGDGPEMSAVAGVLNKAADLIERDGWCQHMYASGNAHCLAGAIDDVAPDADTAWEARWEVTEAVGDDASTWNDVPTRTKAEVVAALRAAAERAA